MKKTTILVLLFSCTTHVTFGWGRLGHQAIANVAVQKANATTRNAVLNILANSKTPEINAPTNAATWPDDIKPGHALSGTAGARAFNKKFAKNPDWHFAN